jgi:hypothetical protein
MLLAVKHLLGAFRSWSFVVAAMLLLPAPAHAQFDPSVASQPRAKHLVEGGLLLAYPAALPTGMVTGIDLSYTRSWRRWLGWGVRASWGSATEYTLNWTVRHDEIRLRLHGVVKRDLGRATIGLRLGLGATLVREGRTSMLGKSSGLSGEDVATSAWAALPAAELEPWVMLRILGGWGVSVGGGPSLHIFEGHARWGFISALRVAWRR